MPRSSVAGFLNGSNTLSISTLDLERTSNGYLELVTPGTGPTAGVIKRRPGLVPLTQFADSPGSTIFYQDGRCFAVVGTTFGEIFDTVGVWSVTAYGTVTAATALLPASIISNGTAGGQLLIASGGNGYVFTLLTNAFTIIDNTTFPGTGFPYGAAQQVEFLDGYGIVTVLNTRQFLISALEDVTSWDPLDVAERSEGSDNLMAMRRNHREIWLLGTKTGEIWYDSGDALFPFAPIPGTFVESGAVSPSMTRVADTVAWVAIDERGRGRVMIAKGYQADPISTPAVDLSIEGSVDLSSTRLWAFTWYGHVFLVVYIADIPVSWVYDFTTSRWFDWSIWNATLCVDEPWLACDHALAFNQHVVVDPTSGVIYQLAPTGYDDSLAT